MSSNTAAPSSENNVVLTGIKYILSVTDHELNVTKYTDGAASNGGQKTQRSVCALFKLSFLTPRFKGNADKFM
jgi:hypothetical protein